MKEKTAHLDGVHQLQIPLGFNAAFAACSLAGGRAAVAATMPLHLPRSAARST
jgi:hypothetical protein